MILSLCKLELFRCVSSSYSFLLAYDISLTLTSIDLVVSIRVLNPAITLCLASLGEKILVTVRILLHNL